MTVIVIALGAVVSVLGLATAALLAQAHHQGAELRRTRRELDHTRRVLAAYRAGADQEITDLLNPNGDPS